MTCTTGIVNPKYEGQVEGSGCLGTDLAVLGQHNKWQESEHMFSATASRRSYFNHHLP
jgi:hypothetical protein